MMNESVKLLKHPISSQSIKKLQKEEDSFLMRYFHSKELVFPEFDQQLMDKKRESLFQLCNQFEHQRKDFKSWILNKYPLNTYFKNILMQNKNNTKILSSLNPLSKKPSQNISTIYIGETQSNLKHGYGLQLKIYSKNKRNKTQKQQRLDNQQQVQYQSEQNEQVEFEGYEGFFQNNLRHGKGKLFSSFTNSKYPNFYFGRFQNGQTYDNTQALMVWKNHDFYLGKVKHNFSKEGLGTLFISNKQLSSSLMHSSKVYAEIKLRNDSSFYQKAIISEWLQNTTKSQSLQNSSNTFHSLLSETKIITHKEFYFGQAYVYYSSNTQSHITVKEGKGQLKLLNGDIYQGSFSLDKINGYGKYIWNNKNFYMGEFQDGQKHGSGFWKEHLTNDEYQGQYQHNKRHGHGEYRWGNGNIYTGLFSNDLREGSGKMIWNTGQIYEGNWKDGLQNGIGSLFFIQGNSNVFIRQSEFVNGVEMETPQQIESLPSTLSKKEKSSQTNKTRRTSNITSSRLKSLPNQSELNKFRFSSQLPRINEKTMMKFKNQSQSKPKSKTQLIEPIIQRMKKRIPRIISDSNQSSKIQHQRSLDCKLTQKLQYHRPLNPLNSPTDKSQKSKGLSFFQNSKKRKTYYVDLQDVRQSQQNKKLPSTSKQLQKSEEKDLKKVNEFFSDTLMIPIKWRNIKTKSHHFILQRKQRNSNANESFN